MPKEESKETGATDKSKAAKNAVAESANWNQRVTSELEAGKVDCSFFLICMKFFFLI